MNETKLNELKNELANELVRRYEVWLHRIGQGFCRKAPCAGDGITGFINSSYTGNSSNHDLFVSASEALVVAFYGRNGVALDEEDLRDVLDKIYQDVVDMADDWIE